MSNQSIEKFSADISERVYYLLFKNDIKTMDELLGKSPCFLRSIGLSSEEMENTKMILTRKVFNGFSTAFDLTETEIFSTRLKIGCTAIDGLLGGGFAIRGINEIYGPSGSGKSQFCIQLSLQAQLSPKVGGLNKGVAYICTEDAFPLKRLHQMNDQYVKRYGNLDFLNNIFIDHINDYENLVDCVQNRLPKLLNNKRIGLIVIDSIAGIFRAEMNLIERANRMRIFVNELLNLQNKFEFAVLCTNQVTAKMNTIFDEVIPCLGLAWSNLVTSRFAINKTNDCIPIAKAGSSKDISDNSISVRIFGVIFSPELKKSKTKFIITENGVCSTQ